MSAFPFTIHTSSPLDGPWTSCQPAIDVSSSNVSLFPPHDGRFQVVIYHVIYSGSGSRVGCSGLALRRQVSWSWRGAPCWLLRSSEHVNLLYGTHDGGREGLQKTGAPAVFGYRSDIDWVEAAAFDVLLLGTLQEVEFTHRGMREAESRSASARGSWRTASGSG